MQVGVEIPGLHGEIKVREPDRCERWEFWPLEALPAPVFVGSVDRAGQIRDGVLLPS